MQWFRENITAHPIYVPVLMDFTPRLVDLTDPQSGAFSAPLGTDDRTGWLIRRPRSSTPWRVKVHGHQVAWSTRDFDWACQIHRGILDDDALASLQQQLHPHEPVVGRVSPGEWWESAEGIRPGPRRVVPSQFAGSSWQRCRVHFMRNIRASVAAKHVPPVMAAVKTIFAHTDPVEVAAQWDQVTDTFAGSFPKVAALMEAAKHDVLAFTAFPKAHWQKIWSNNPIERLNKEIPVLYSNCPAVTTVAA